MRRATPLFLTALSLAGSLGCRGDGSDPPPPTTPAFGPGSLIPGFGTDGVVTSNPSPRDDSPRAAIENGSDLWVVGYDESPGPGDLQWRIEKRSLSSGNLVAAFGTGGVVTVNPSTRNDQAYAVASDGTNLYVVGFDESPGVANWQWRIEKRSVLTGALVAGFGTGGVLTVNPGAGADRALGVVATGGGTDIVLVGSHDLGSGDIQWRIEKRSASTGGLVAAFGSGGALTLNPSVRDDEAYVVANDGTDLYVAGIDETPAAGDWQWRVEKLSLSSGSAVTTFGSGGAVVTNPSAVRDEPWAVTQDGTNLTIGGYDRNLAPGNGRWRIEKRSLASGLLVAAFGTSGVLLSDLSLADDYAEALLLDGANFYVTGFDQVLGNARWRIEERNATSGALVGSFGSGGVVVSDPSSRADDTWAVLTDGNNLFVVGNDLVPGLGDREWRIEKRLK
ncbi:MAG: hypothetical protein L0216_04275 [Planctomycetales bacterium]|nr:hypothetical protein [Planctomycetales bacterium]